MYIYAELWSGKEAWKNLPAERRAAYVESIGPGMQELLATGVQLLGFAINDADTPHRADFDYLAVWTMTDRSQVDDLEATVAAAGWYDWFDQVNARGLACPPPEVLGHMIEHSA